MVSRIPRALLIVSAIGTLGGCGPREDPNSPGAVYRSIQRQVFDVSCAIQGCHRGPQSDTGLDLTAGRSYRALVNVRSTQMADLLRVAPGNPDRSYLVMKLEGKGIVGEPMPQGRPSLPPGIIERIRAWIREGAPGAETP